MKLRVQQYYWRLMQEVLPQVKLLSLMAVAQSPDRKT